MIDRMLKDMSKAKDLIYSIQSKDFNLYNSFKAIDLEENQDYYSINDFQFRKTNKIERIEEIESIDYIFKYDNSEVAIMCMK